MKRNALFLALFAISASAHAIDGEILITQAKAMAGNVTPGDTPGFPVTISKSGKYKLAGDLDIPDAHTNGININVPNVEIDLNGFGIYGPNTCTGSPVTSCANNDAQYGIISSFADSAVRNGTVMGMSGSCIYLGQNSVVENVNVSECAIYGIALQSGMVKNVLSHHNFSSGVRLASTGVISGSTIRFNGNGVAIVQDALVTGNSISRNGYYGIVGSAGLASTNGYSNNVLSGNATGKALHATDLGGNL